MAGDRATERPTRAGYAENSQPKGRGGTMPGTKMFPRVKSMATGVIPNPHEQVPGSETRVTPVRFVGMFGEKKPHKISILAKTGKQRGGGTRT